MLFCSPKKPVDNTKHPSNWGMWHLFCFDFQFYIEMFFGDTMNVSPILKKGNVTILTFFTHDEQITYSYDV